ncbi:hypothetical protein [Aeromicrobium chenweiae]|uniref:Uncharacterized protein n=1 Tax=Aeromicrobium chenweiae TaxID=2079793 RepID=A0A2S0WNL9_9ACTN|nr:hypothetical protein [Aeromicrobium chenweiae]AWB92943.1 hypothetical protein C3E78_12415 [Aeromicrobium chenweiae]TGN33936.1 hypothetical protein E4L97_02465 [Aeromicrobium chenweiae]
MFKRLIVAASVSAIAVIGLGPVAGATAASPSKQVVVKVKAVQPKISKPRVIDWDAPGKAIDWDAPAPAAGSGGGFSTQRIDWD